VTALVALLVLLVAGPAHAGVSFTGATVAGVTTAPRTLTAPPDWSGFLARYRLEESSGTIAQTGGTCGTDCDLPFVSGYSQTQNGRREGSYAASFTAFGSASCNVATCDESQLTGSIGIKKSLHLFQAFRGIAKS